MCASLLIASGTTDMRVADQMGHSKVGTTKNIYGHLFAQDRASVLDAMNQAVSRLCSARTPPMRSTGFSESEMLPLATVLATVKVSRESSEAADLGALGGTRTPNLLIRRQVQAI